MTDTFMQGADAQEKQYQKNRVYELIIADPKTGDAIKITNPLNIKFEIKKCLDNSSKLNTATFEVYNLSRTTYQQIEKILYPIVTFSCGYEGSGMALVFTGNAMTAGAQRHGVDMIYTLQCTESFVQLCNVLPAKTFAAGTSVKTVIKHVVSLMQDVVYSDEGLVDNPRVDSKLESGYPCEGTPRQIFTELARAYRLQWRCDLRTVYFRDDGGKFSTPPTDTFDISPQSGLLDVPHRHQYKNARSTQDGTLLVGVEFKTLLNPRLTSGKIVQITTGDPNTDGIFQIRDIEYKGELRGQDWECHILSNQIKGKT